MNNNTIFYFQFKTKQSPHHQSISHSIFQFTNEIFIFFMYENNNNKYCLIGFVVYTRNKNEKGLHFIFF
jgi:hypothetical protein